MRQRQVMGGIVSTENYVNKCTRNFTLKLQCVSFTRDLTCFVRTENHLHVLQKIIISSYNDFSEL